MTEETRQNQGKCLPWLEQEVRAWQEDGIIEGRQAQAILDRYQVNREKEETEKSGKLVSVLAIIGALLLGIGVILFFASNWQAIPKVWKVALILSSAITAYGIGYYLAFGKGSYPKIGSSLIFLGTILYGSGIWLIAQIFHISSHYPNGVLFWAVGILPVVLVCGSLSVLIEAALLLTLWTVMEQTGFENNNYLFLPLIAITVLLGHRLKSRLAVGLTLPGVVIWVGICTALAFRDSFGYPYIFIMTALMGLFLYAIGNLQDLKAELAPMKVPYKIVGLGAFLLSLYILSFRVFIYGFENTARTFEYPMFFILTLGVVILGLGIAGVISLREGKNHLGLIREGAFILASAIPLFILAFSTSFLTVKAFLALTNLLLFICIIAVIVIGYSNRELILINFGLLFFVLDVIARYFDFFWDMLPKSIFFMVGGLLLLMGGYLLERNRRKILREIRGNNYAA